MSNLDEVIYKHTKRKALIFSRNKNDKRIKQVSIINYVYTGYDEIYKSIDGGNN